MEQRLGNYDLKHLLGSGGFADVYYAEHLYLKTSAAIKVLRVKITHDEQEKFLAEARIAAQLEHPHILSVLEFGIEHTTPYLVMDYAANGTVRQQYPKGTRLTTTQILPAVAQISSALSYTHQRQLIHRDVKPENMLLNSKYDVLLSDFGIALVVQRTQRSDAQQRIVGTIAYMAPEQFRGEPCPASDQYSLAAVIYEWLCGEPPFYGSYTEVAIQHALVAPLPLRKRVPQLSAGIEEVIMIALAKEPQARFKSIQAFATAFAQACVAQPHAESIARSGDTSPHNDASKDGEDARPAKKPHARRTFVVALSLLGGVSLLAGGTAVWKFLLQGPQTSSTVKQSGPQHTPTATHSIAGPGTTLYTYYGHDGGPVYSLSWSNDSQRIASASDNVQVWNAQTGKLDTVYRNSPHGSILINAVAWSPDNKYIAVGTVPELADAVAAIYVWDVSTEQVAYTYQHIQNYQVKALAWSPDGTAIASTDGKTVQVWQALTGSLITSYTGHTSSINSLTWSPDGKWIASSDGATYQSSPIVSGTVHVWDAATGQMSLIYHGHPDAVVAVAWSPNGQFIASAGGFDYPAQASDPNSNTVQIWKPTIDNPVLTYHGHTGPVKAVAWSPTSAYVVSGSSNNGTQSTTALAQIWNATTGQTLLSYQGHNFQADDEVAAVAWSPDGKRIASAGFALGGWDTTVQVWKATI